MLPVGDRPLMEYIVSQLRGAGIRHVSIATHYKAEHISGYFGDGRQFGLDIDYLNEKQPLGTAGALSLVPPWRATLLVINGDVLTRLNYRAMLEFHRDNAAMLTVAVRQYDVQVPYGVVETRGVEILGVKEKPVVQFFVNAGIYLLEPGVHASLVANERLDMTDLVTRLIDAGQRVVSFPISEYWIDIGQREDYTRAQDDVRTWGAGV
jgi:NDP-sugar pyrophosphorylase family protein